MKLSARHGLAAAACALFAVVWTLPLALHLSTHIPGPGAGDNVSFLWNFWWMREAVASGQSPFQTAALFAPAGANLTLHTHTMLPAFAGATVLGGLPLAVALNLTILAGISLNAFSAYLLAWRVTRDYAAALLGGLVFAGAPYFAGHLYGHFNLTMAWTVPLFAMAAIEGLRGSRGWAIGAGVILGLTAYIDYYYVVFQLVLVLALIAVLDRGWSVRFRGTEGRRGLSSVLAGLIATDALLILGIFITGGFEMSLGGKRLSFHTIFNPLQLLWLLSMLWLIARFRPSITIDSTAARPRLASQLTMMAASFALIAAPIVWHGASLIAKGEYVTQRYYWRSAPSGVDLGTVALGNPFGGPRRSGSQWLYDTFGIDNIEGTAWLGIVPLALGAFVIRRGWRADADCSPAHALGVRTWAVVGGVFLIWAFGSHLMLFGVNTGMVLPQAAARYLPIVGNARIPGRAMVMVWMSLSVLVALALATWRPGRFQRGTVLTLAATAIAFDFMAAPIPLTALDRPAIYETLRDRPEAGAVCELPMGIRDGFRAAGHLDHRTLAYQTIHGRPMTGGFVARLPPSTLRAYEQDALLAALLKLSSPEENRATVLPDPTAAAERLRAHGISFVMLNRRLSPPALVEYVTGALPLQLVAKDEERSLYLVTK